MAAWLTGPVPLLTPVADRTTAVPAAARVSFTTALPFTQEAYFPRYQVAGALTFTANTSGAVAGAGVEMELVANGTNVPAFTGFKEDSRSAGYLNTTGIVNSVRAWYTGVAYMYIVSRARTVTAAPRLLSVQATAAQTLTLTYSKSLNSGTVPALTAFALTGSSGAAQSVSSVVISGTSVTLTLSRAQVASETTTVAYVPPVSNALVSTDGMAAGSASAQAVYGVPVNTVAPALSSMYPVTGTVMSVSSTWTSPLTITYTYQWKWADTGANISGATASSYTVVSGDANHQVMCTVTATTTAGAASANSNNVAVSGYVRLQDRTLTETVTGTGYTYGTSSDSASNTFASGFASGALSSSGSIAMTPNVDYSFCSVVFNGMGASADGILLGLRLVQGKTGYTNLAYCLYTSTSGGNTYYRQVTHGVMGACATNLAFASGHVMRLRKSLNGNTPTLYAEVSTDNGVSFTTVHSWILSLTYDLYLVLNACGPAQARLPSAARFA